MSLSTAFSQGFSQGYGVTSTWKKNKEAKAKIDKAAEELRANGLQLAAAFDRDRADGTITEQEYGDRVSWGMSVSYETLGMVETMYKGYKNWTEEELASGMENLTAMYEILKDSDSTDLREFKQIAGKFTNEKAKNMANIYIQDLESRQPKEKEEEPEYFTDLPKLKAKYGEGAKGQFAAGKGWVYTGEEKKAQPKSSDYINLMNVLGAVAKSKSNEEFQAFKKNMETETGINLGKLNRSTFIDLPDPEEIRRMSLDDVLFGSRGLMNEYAESAEDLDDEMKAEIRSKWKLYKPLMSAADQQRGDAYFTSIGIDLYPPQIDTDIDIDTGDDDEKGFFASRLEDVKAGAQGLSDWIDRWIEPEQFPKKF